MPFAEVFVDFNFLVEWGGTSVGMTRVTPLVRSRAVLDVRGLEGPQQKVPGIGTFHAFTLERRLQPRDMEFQTWMEQVQAGGTGFRRDLTISLLDADNAPVIVFKARNCWPSSYQGFSTLNAEEPGVVLETLTVETEGWVRADP